VGIETVGYNGESARQGLNSDRPPALNVAVTVCWLGAFVSRQTETGSRPLLTTSWTQPVPIDTVTPLGTLKTARSVLPAVLAAGSEQVIPAVVADAGVAVN
jgi:hypothetical protein